MVAGSWFWPLPTIVDKHQPGSSAILLDSSIRLPSEGKVATDPNHIC